METKLGIPIEGIRLLLMVAHRKQADKAGEVGVYETVDLTHELPKILKTVGDETSLFSRDRKYYTEAWDSHY